VQIMAVTREQVRAALESDEPRYRQLAAELGPEALPFLDELVGAGPPLLAAKATHLAALIDPEDAHPVILRAAQSSDDAVRVAAAAAARHLSPDSAQEVLKLLLDDRDAGVRKAALNAVPANASDALRLQVAHIAGRELQPHVHAASLTALRRLAGAPETLPALAASTVMAAAATAALAQPFGAAASLAAAATAFGSLPATTAPSAPAPLARDRLAQPFGSAVDAGAAEEAPSTPRAAKARKPRSRARAKPASPRKTKTKRAKPSQ
jgi:hypothetical protein